MASRITSIRSLLPEFDSALQSFTASSSKFRVVQTVNPSTTQPKTLYVLDSSFNPPSKAHLTLATCALRDHAPSESGPYRFLLLFSTHNADKAPSPASFAQRIAMMTVFAEDLSHHLKTCVPNISQDISSISIDIGLTTEPYYADKSIAIAETRPPFYSSRPHHVHLIGYDTLIRFCNPRYYPNHHPPLSALGPFFHAGHKLRVTQRPADNTDESSAGFGTAEEQVRYLDSLRKGEMEEQGFESAWGHAIDMAQADQGISISSTRVRHAAREGKWHAVNELCSHGVAAWIRHEVLYREDAASGAKMMS